MPAYLGRGDDVHGHVEQARVEAEPHDGVLAVKALPQRPVGRALAGDISLSNQDGAVRHAHSKVLEALVGCNAGDHRLGVGDCHGAQQLGLTTSQHLDAAD